MASKIEIIFTQDRRQDSIAKYDPLKDPDFIEIAKSVFDDRDAFESFKTEFDNVFQDLVRLHVMKSILRQ